MRSLQPSLWVVAMLALPSLWSCRHDEGRSAGPANQRFTLVRMQVADGTPNEHRPVLFKKTELTTMVEAALENIGLAQQVPGRAQSPWILFTARIRSRGLPVPREAWEVRLDVHTVYGIATDQGIASTIRSGLSKAVWSADLRLKPPDHEDSVYSYIETTDENHFGGVPAEARQELRARLAASVVVLASQVELRLRMASQDLDYLIESLKASDAEIRLAVVERLSMFKDKRAVLALAERLGVEEEHSIRLRIIGALAESRSPAAVTALIGFADPRDRESLRAILDALSAIGGRQVADFLGVLSSHDAADIREMVETARSRLRRNRSRGPSTPTGSENQGTTKETP